MTTQATPTELFDNDMDFPDVDFPDVDFPDDDFPDIEFPDLSDDYLLLDSSDWEDLGLGPPPPPSQQFPTGSEWDNSWLGPPPTSDNNNNNNRNNYSEQGFDIVPFVIVGGVAFVLIWIFCATVGNKKYKDQHANSAYKHNNNTNLCVNPGTNDLVTDDDTDVIELKEVVVEPQQVVLAQAVAVESTEVAQIPSSSSVPNSTTTRVVTSTAPVADTRDCEAGEFRPSLPTTF